MVQVKCVIVGDEGTGRRCIVRSLIDGKFNPYNEHICDLAGLSKSLEVDGRKFEIGIWETNGSSEYDRLRPLTYPQTDFFLLCFSLISPESLEHVASKWKPELEIHANSVPIVLVGTKSDLRSNSTQIKQLTAKNQLPISAERGQSMAEQIKAAKYVECSAHSQEELRTLFTEGIRLLYPPERKCSLQ